MRSRSVPAILSLGLLIAAGASAPEAAESIGTLDLSLLGNGRICARLHEDIVVEKISEKQAWKRLFTTYGYRFRLFAVRSDTGVEITLLDTGDRRTYDRRKERVSRPARNPLPHSAGTERVRVERDYWVKQTACRSFARRSKYRLMAGTFTLRVLYQVQAPNGTWFVEIDETGPTWDIRPGEVTNRRFMLLDDGNRREVAFLEKPDPAVPAENAAADDRSGPEEAGE